MEVETNTESNFLKIFIENYLEYCLLHVNSEYYLKNSSKSLLQMINEEDEIENRMNELFTKFITRNELNMSYNLFKLVLNEKNDINSYILFLIGKIA